MSERCFVKVAWDPACSAGQVRRAVGGFLRYIQHRDLHPGSTPERKPAGVAGLLKYVAYRDQASTRAELFGPEGRLGTQERKDFAEYIGRSVDQSRPQLYRSRSGELVDRRRVVSRFVISPEVAAGLDLERLARAGVSHLESEMGVSGLRWIAAIHRNTRHHHVHLVLAGLHQAPDGSYRRVDITKPRLAAMKEAVGLEIERQRGERTQVDEVRSQTAGVATGGNQKTKPALTPLVPPALIRTPPVTLPAPASAAKRWAPSVELGPSTSVLRLRALARRYQRRMQHDAADEARRMRWERAA